MAAVELTVQDIGLSGLDFSMESAEEDGNFFDNDGRVYLHVFNDSGGALVVTIESEQDCDQDFDHDPIPNIPDTATVLIGPFPVRRFNNSNGQVDVSYDELEGVEVAAIRLPLT